MNTSTIPKFYHLGCGLTIVDGYVNVDADLSWIEKDMKEGSFYSVSGKPETFVVSHDLRKGIPARKESVEVIYHSHLLEHLADEAGKAFLATCFRCLVPGGIMRMAVPDFRLWCENYVSGNDEFFDWYRDTYLNSNKARYPTRASVFMGMLYNWEHKMGYDWDSAFALLSEIGFSNIRKATWGVSDGVKNIALLENESPRKFESLIVECTKSV